MFTTRLITSSPPARIGSKFSSLLFGGWPVCSTVARLGTLGTYSVFDFIKARAFVEFCAFGLYAANDALSPSLAGCIDFVGVIDLARLANVLL